MTAKLEFKIGKTCLSKFYHTCDSNQSKIKTTFIQIDDILAISQKSVKAKYVKQVNPTESTDRSNYSVQFYYK